MAREDAAVSGGLAREGAVSSMEGCSCVDPMCRCMQLFVSNAQMRVAVSLRTWANMPRTASSETGAAGAETTPYWKVVSARQK